MFEFIDYQYEPRDSLVRFAFSLHKCGSSLLNEMVKDVCAQDVGITIDEYAKKYIHQHKNRLEFYSDTLDMENTRVYKYEDIYFDKFSFLKSIFEYWGYTVNEQTIENVVRKRDIRPEKEDPTQHIRKGTPGDHIEKLERSTIDYINDVMRPISSRFGYDL